MKRWTDFNWYLAIIKLFKPKNVIPEGQYCHGVTVQDPNNPMVRLCPNRCPYQGYITDCGVDIDYCY